MKEEKKLEEKMMEERKMEEKELVKLIERLSDI